MTIAFRERLRTAFAPPKYIALPLSGIDVSASGVKAVRLVNGKHGLVLSDYAEVKLPQGAFADGEISDRTSVVDAIVSATRAIHISSTNAALPETKSFLFETTVTGTNADQWRTEAEQRLDELIPLPPQETDFDLVKIDLGTNGETHVVGIGFARRVVDEVLSALDQANVMARVLEGETFAMARALIPYGDISTMLIIDIGKTTTKLAVVTGRIPRFATTINIGGHALTLAVQKHFGVTETEVRKIKAQRGIVPTQGNEDYIAAMLSTVSAIRDEISVRLKYWQDKAVLNGAHEPVSRAILAGGNASLRGLPEYLEGTLQIPVSTGDVFTNLASRDTWVPSLDYTESLAYATAIGLALRDSEQLYE